MLVAKQLLEAIDFHSMGKKNTMEVTNVLQNIFFCVQQKK